jgi:mRNA-degrading endonuclease RelE of RelBE toxin-antitoxin system
MSYSISRTDEFNRPLKQLAKKISLYKKDYQQQLVSLGRNPLQGTATGRNCYTVRGRIRSKQTGKSGDARLITYVKIEDKYITLPDVY